MNKYLLKIDVNTFNLKYTLECGQCFRWDRLFENEEDKSNLIYEYIGVISDRVVNMRQEGSSIYINSDKEDGLEASIYNYFDMFTDYGKLEKEISKIDTNIEEAVKNTSGIRILNQPVFETIISYIISANNNISRIRKSVNAISKKYGTKIFFEDKEYYLFPNEKQLAIADMDNLLEAGVGFRARYIRRAVEKILSEDGYIERLETLSTEEAKEKLIQLEGVGPKVSDCILLFSLKRKEIFPIDVWIKRIMEKIYFQKNVDIKEISKFAREKYGKNSGIVQEHFFYNVREGRL